MWVSSNFGPGNRADSPAEAAIELGIFLQNALILVVRETRDALRMMRNQTANFRNLAAQFFLGSIALALVSLVFFWLQVDLASPLAIMAFAGPAYCFAPPIFDFRIEAPTGGGVVIQLGGRQQSHHLKRDEQGE